jgi:hypothetical protein
VKGHKRLTVKGKKKEGSKRDGGEMLRLREDVDGKRVVQRDEVRVWGVSREVQCKVRSSGVHIFKGVPWV